MGAGGRGGGSCSARMSSRPSGLNLAMVPVVQRRESLRVEGLEAWCREALAGYKVPTQWELRATGLPRNASGKVLKTVLTGEAPDPGVGD